MGKPIASAKPNSSIVMVTNGEGKVRYYLCNSVNINEGHTIWDTIGKQYRSTIRDYRHSIDSTLARVYRQIPHYKDADISSIRLLMDSMKSSKTKKVAMSIYNFIKEREQYYITTKESI